MKVLLTSCGLETGQIEDEFLTMLAKDPRDVKALFIPTAATDAGAVMVLGECMNDLLKVGITEENIRVFDLHDGMSPDELRQYDLIYFCGGRAQYLLDRINETGFDTILKQYIAENGMVLGVSAGSIIFANNLPRSLGLLDTRLFVHCDRGDQPQTLAFPLQDETRLSNTAAIVIRDIPDDCRLIDQEM